MPHGFRFPAAPRPRNRPAVDAAITALRTLTPTIVEQHQNALEVNGYEVLVYNRLRTGVQCSCSGGGVGAGAGTILNGQGQANEATLQELLLGGVFGYRKYGESDSLGDRSAKPTVHTRDEDSQADRRVPNHGETEFDGNGYTNATGKDDGSGDAMDFPLNPFAEGHLISCPVCFGTGFVGGYSVCNSWRYVLSSVFPTELDGGAIDINPKPNAFQLYSPGSTAMFEVRLPAGAVSVDSMRVFDGVRSLGGEVMLEFWDENLQPTPGWAMLTPKKLLSLCNGTVYSMRVMSQVSDLRFTHVELQLGLSRTPLLVEFPRLSENADVSILEGIQDVSLVMSPLIPQLRTFDIISDLHNRKLWMMREVQRFDNNARANGTSLRANYGYDAQARMIQGNEIWSILPVRTGTINRHQRRPVVPAPVVPAPTPVGGPYDFPFDGVTPSGSPYDFPF